MNETQTKQCTKCKVEKPATSEYFSKDKTKRDGLRPSCKTCKRADDRLYYKTNPNRHREWRDANQEHLREYRRQYRKANAEKVREQYSEWYKANAEARAEYMKEYRQANKNKLRDQSRRWAMANSDKISGYRRKQYRNNKEKILASQADAYRANPEKKREYAREYRKANPEKTRFWKARRRSRLLNASGSHTASDIRKQYRRQKGKCYYCHCKVGKSYHVDHVIPISRGGSNSPENLVIACQSCNQSKKDKLPHEWARGGRLL